MISLRSSFSWFLNMTMSAQDSTDRIQEPLPWTEWDSLNYRRSRRSDITWRLVYPEVQIPVQPDPVRHPDGQTPLMHNTHEIQTCPKRTSSLVYPGISLCLTHRTQKLTEFTVWGVDPFPFRSWSKTTKHDLGNFGIPPSRNLSYMWPARAIASTQAVMLEPDFIRSWMHL